MTHNEYIKVRAAMRKEADGKIPVISDIWSGITGMTSSALKSVGGAALSSAALALPTAAISLAYLIAKARSPKAVADSAPEYAMNAMEKETLAQSLRDLEDSEIRALLRKAKHRHHDQFI